MKAIRFILSAMLALAVSANAVTLSAEAAVPGLPASNETVRHTDLFPRLQRLQRRLYRLLLGKYGFRQGSEQLHQLLFGYSLYL